MFILIVRNTRQNSRRTSWWWWQICWSARTTTPELWTPAKTSDTWEDMLSETRIFFHPSASSVFSDVVRYFLYLFHKIPLSVFLVCTIFKYMRYRTYVSLLLWDGWVWLLVNPRFLQNSDPLCSVSYKFNLVENYNVYMFRIWVLSLYLKLRWCTWTKRQ